ncbi:MAG TPA: cysteine hydrolase [Acetobacteraceae bacterium]|nr:cysteine hydrolase [Acetobacteraceae bacterium]
MSWLMVIDVQPAFSHPESPWFTPTLEEVSRRIELLVDRFGARVTFTRFVPPAAPFGSWTSYYARWPFALRPEAESLWALDRRWAGRPTLDSHTFSKWLPTMRERIGAEDVVMCGVSTDCCVLMTALAAVDDGAHVRVVEDACAAKTEELHRRALAIMGDRAPQLRITTVAEELAR